MVNKDSQFSLSKADLFVIFHANKIKNIAYMIVFFVIVSEIINGRNFLEGIKLIFLVILVIEPLYFFVKRKSKRIPYKIAINLDQKIVNFIMCFTDTIKTFSFSEIKGIIDDPQYYIIYTNERKRFAWCKNKENNEVLTKLLHKTGIRMIQGRRSLFDYRLLWE